MSAPFRANDETSKEPSKPAAPVYRISRAVHGVYVVTDAGGLVASTRFCPTRFAWIIAASAERFPKLADLPAVFAGKAEHEIRTFGDLFRFFGCDLPRVPTPRGKA